MPLKQKQKKVINNYHFLYYNKIGDSMTKEDIIKLLETFTYSEIEINKILNSHEISSMKPNTVWNRIKENTEYLLSLGLSLKELKMMISLCPAIYGLSLSNLKDTINTLIEQGFKDEYLVMIKKNPQILESNIDTIKNTVSKIMKLGYTDNNQWISYHYTEKEAKKIFSSYPGLVGFEINTLNDKVSSLIELGLEPKSVRTMILNWGIILSKNPASYMDKKKKFMEFGFTEPQALKIIKENGSLLSRTEDVINNRSDFLMKLGYSKKGILRLLSSTPAILSFDNQNIENKIKNLMTYGYTIEQVIAMTLMHTPLLSYSIPRVNKRIEDLMNLGYEKNDVLNSIYKFPGLFGFSESTLKEKILYLKEIGLGIILMKSPKDLMQGIDLTYARIEFLKEKGIPQTEEDYYLLFQDNKYFTKRFHITKEELIEKYSYQKYKESKNEPTF